MLEKQKTDVMAYVSVIKEYTEENFIDSEWGGTASKTDFRIMNIMEEWEGMFSFSPGITERIPLIQALLMKIVLRFGLDITDLYKTDEWNKIIELRGPVETVLERKCENCGCFYYSMGLSGFIDGNALICNRCGDVYFKSYYEDLESPKCECNGKFISGCPKCGEQASTTVKCLSPYEYFADHKFLNHECL